MDGRRMGWGAMGESGIAAGAVRSKPGLRTGDQDSVCSTQQLRRTGGCPRLQPDLQSGGRGMTTTNPVVDAAPVGLLLHELRLPRIRLVWAKLAPQSDTDGCAAAPLLAALP